MSESFAFDAALRNLMSNLDQLPAEYEAKLVRGALKAAATPIQREAQQLAPRDTGTLSVSIKATAAIKKRAGEIVAKVKAGSKFKVSKKKGENGQQISQMVGAFYAHFVEFGTHKHLISASQEVRPGRTTRRGYRKYSVQTMNRMIARGSLVIGGKFVGKSVMHPGAKAEPFMRPAFDHAGQASVDAYGAYVRANFDKMVEKARKAGAI